MIAYEDLVNALSGNMPAPAPVQRVASQPQQVVMEPEHPVAAPITGDLADDFGYNEEEFSAPNQAVESYPEPSPFDDESDLFGESLPEDDGGFDIMDEAPVQSEPLQDDGFDIMDEAPALPIAAETEPPVENQNVDFDSLPTPPPEEFDDEYDVLGLSNSDSAVQHRVDENMEEQQLDHLGFPTDELPPPPPPPN
ncbi:hypothetical protein KKF34_13545 [Myxococcota bacterium]|nr:hypothetical protein [Myxococcota bacterium]MBU1380556.1 hypothetical protein [Myxococcota bacterium]MBU1497894.1 hypothetical protein [Myxococcota bacterium]